MNEASKTLLFNAVKEWMKFVNERERMTGIANEVSAIAQRVVLESLSFLKAQNVDIECQDVGSMKVMGQPVVIEPVVDAVFPNVKTKVTMTCSGANRSIVINPNASISAGGNPFMFDQFKKGIPESFVTNAAEFVSDAFLFVARNQTPEVQAATQQQSQSVSPPAPPPTAGPPATEPPQVAPVALQQPKPAQAPLQPKPVQSVPQQPKPPQPGAPIPRPSQPAPPIPKPPQPPKPPGQKPPGT